MSRDGRRELDPMITARRAAGGVCVDGHRFLVVGGLEGNGSNILSSCEFYDASATPPQWKPFPIDMPVARWGCGVASVGGKVYVFGGVGDDGSRGELISIDVSGDDLSALDGRRWETLAPMNQNRRDFACASDTGSDPPCIYVFGGWDEGTRRLDTAEKYNIGTNTWEPLQEMPGKRSGCAAGKVGNKIYVVGGQDENLNPLSSTFVFDISIQRWDSAIPVSDMKAKRAYLSVVVVDGYVVAIGGHEDTDGSRSTMEILDTQQNSWVESRARTNHSRFYSMAGFLSGRKEIIVTGTEGSARSESIPFDEDLSGAFDVQSDSDEPVVEAGVPYWSEEESEEESGSSPASNKKETALRGAELFKQQSHFSLSKHKLAAIHLSARQYTIFTIPMALLAMSNGIIAFVASTNLYEERTNLILTCIVDSLSFVLVYLQTLSTQRKYDVRAEMHEGTALDLRDLVEDLGSVVNKSIVLIHYRNGVDLMQRASNQEEETEETVEQIFDGIQKRYNQCLKGCKSTVPLEINNAFELLDSRLNATLSKVGHRKLKEMYGSNYNNVIYFQACNDLAARFSCFWKWPLFLPNPVKAVDATIDQLRKTIEDGSNYWNFESTHLLTNGNRSIQSLRNCC